MALPIINFKFTNTESNESLQDLVTQKLESIASFIGDEPDVTIDVEFEKEAPKESGPVFRVEANVMIKGELYRADASLESFEAAIDEVRDELDKELSRAHDKMITQARDGARQAKEMMQSDEQ